MLRSLLCGGNQMETLFTSLAVAIVTALLTVLLPKLLDRKWKKEDRGRDETQAILKAQQGQINVLVEAQKVTMQDRVRYLGKKYVETGHVSISDRETLEDMYRAYKSLGGNGHLNPTMDAVRSLPQTAD